MSNIFKAILNVLLATSLFSPNPVEYRSLKGNKEKKYALKKVYKNAKKVERKQIAFAGAEGPGAYCQGGYGGKTLYVTTLEDTEKQGSLRWALDQDYPRIIEFKVSGIISLNDHLKVRNSFVTIDGSTAPGNGVTIKDGSIVFNEVHDVIVRYLRVRPSDEVVLKKGRWKKDKRKGAMPKDAISIETCAYVIVDHCSVSWTSDEGLSVVNSRNVTVQRCLIAEPLSNPKLHIEDGKEVSHAKAALVNGKDVVYLKNCMAYFKDRGPQIGNGKVAAINNVVGFYENSGTRLTPDVGDKIKAIILNNVYLNRLYDDAPDIHLVNPPGELPSGFECSFYIAGNIGPLRLNDHMDEWSGVRTDGWSEQTLKKWRAEKPMFRIFPLKLLPTEQVVNDILRNVGAMLPMRDAIDNRVINQIYQRKGSVIVSQDDVDGFDIR